MTNNKIEFYLLCYNNTFCVEYQIKTLRAFCKDPFEIIIIDTNCGEFKENSLEKKKMCEHYGVTFLTLPNHLSNKHLEIPKILGNKLNFVYYNLIKKRKPKYFAFLDQDFFMIRPFTIIDFLDKHGMYGDVMEADNYRSNSFKKEDIIDGPWVLHPWLSFYKYDFIKDYSMNWLPCPHLDTGGMNWEAFFKHKNLDKRDYWFRENIITYYPFVKQSNAGEHPYENHYFNFLGKKYYGQIQINNSFIHLLNSNILTNVMHPKTAYFKGILDAILLTNGIQFDKTNFYETMNSIRNKW